MFHQCVNQKHSLSMAIKRHKKCVQHSLSDVKTFYKFKYALKNQYNNSRHKMHHFVTLYSQRNSIILGSADIGIHFYGDI